MIVAVCLFHLEGCKIGLLYRECRNVFLIIMRYFIFTYRRDKGGEKYVLFSMRI